MKLLRVIAWLGMGIAAAGGESLDRVYSVCEVMARARELNGKTVKVRGEVQESMEGAWLKSEGCPTQYFVGDQSLQMALWLWHESEFGAAAPRNDTHIESVQREIKRKRKKGKDSVLLLTYVGVFETRREWHVTVFGGGRKQLWGFGHLNAAPAQLVVVDVEDPVVVRRR